MNFNITSKIYTIFSFTVCLFLVYLIALVKKTNIDLKRRLIWTLTIGILSTTFYSFFITFYDYKLCYIFGTLFFISLDWLVFSFLQFTFSYTKIKPFQFLKIFYGLVLIDSISLLINLKTHHSFELVQQFTSDGIGYWGTIFYPVHYFHLALTYSIIFLNFALLIISSLKAPSFYKRKYGTIVIFYITIIFVNFLCYSLNTPIDYSVALYGVLAFLIIFYSNYTFPQFLVNKSLSSINESLSSPLFYFDYNGKMTYSNTCAKKLFSNNEAKLKQIAEQTREFYLSTKETKISKVINSKTHNFTIEYKNFSFHESIVGSYLKLEDVTVQTHKIEEQKLIATHDSLTGLFNREGFFEEIEKALKNNIFKAPLILTSNIRDFKLLNEVYGEQMGNEVLVKQASMMKEKAHPKNINGRICDDKFAIFMEKDEFNQEILIDSFQQLKQLTDDNVYNMSIAIGVYEVYNRKESVQLIYDKAKMAMDSIKENFQQMFAFYDSSLLDKLVTEKNIVSQFDKALEDMQFKLALQPIMTFDGKVVGAEALVRWKQNDKSQLLPESFLHVLEHTGLIYKLDLYIWNFAAKKIREWNKKGICDKYISVNISSKDRFYLDIFKELTEITEKYQIKPDSLILEVQEDFLINDFEESISLFKKLKNYGFKFYIDRFGTGFSSLNVLKDFEADGIKIDTKFLGEEGLKEKNKIILESIISMSKELNMQVIAGRVETNSQVNIFNSMGCLFYQGFYFSKPLLVQNFEKMFLS